VRVAAGRDGDGLVITVTDTGIGIPEADLARVFDPFVQLDASLARRFTGAGLGLYLARALVESHGGTLALASVPGAGTTAALRLPAHRLRLPLPQEPP
jgi:signal transduction histidine kinase